VSGPEEGVMGVHFAKPALFDGKIDVEHPEVLVYEPKNGRLHLVAAEYIVPAPAWDPASDPSGNPHVMGHLYHFVPGPNRYGPASFYELHVWAWKDNPHGPSLSGVPTLRVRGAARITRSTARVRSGAIVVPEALAVALASRRFAATFT